MPRKSGYKSGGFVDPLSLIAVGVLLVSLAVGAVTINKKGADFNPNEGAALICLGTCYSGNSCESLARLPADGSCQSGQVCCGAKTGGSVTPTPTPTPTSSSCVSGTCRYGSSSCSSLGLKSGNGTCSGGVCCGDPLTNNCTNGDSYCVDDNTVAVCKTDKSGYKTQDCATEYKCDSAQKKCVPKPTTTPSPCAGECFWGISACSTVSRYSSSGACPGSSICCGDIFSINNCTNGNSYCVDNNTVAVCKVDKSGYTQTDCAATHQCESSQKRCVLKPTPQPTNCAKTNESCSNQTCCNSSDVCEPLYAGKFCVAKGDCSPGASKCVAEGLTSFVYTCSVNGYWQKERACDFGCDGTSCKAVCTPGAKQCSGDELETCNSTGTAWVGQSCTYGCQTVNGNTSCKADTKPSLYTSYVYTPPTPSNEWQEGTAACMNDPESDACKEWNKKQLTEAAIVGTTLLLAPLAVPEIGAIAYAYGTAALTTLPASIQTAAAITGTMAGYAGVAAGTVACAVNPYSEGCIAYIAGIQGDPTALAQLANSADDLINSVFANSFNKTFSWANSSLSPNTNIDDAANAYFDGSATQILKYQTNKYLKSVTGYNIDDGMLPTVMARDSRIVKTKYGIPSSELNNSNPYEYKNQLIAIAKANDIDIIPSYQTTFFDKCTIAGGVCFDAGDVFARTTVVIKEGDDLIRDNRILTHELVHGLQNKKYPSMPIEVREYEAYLSEMNPIKIETIMDPADANFQAGFMRGSVNYWYEQQGLISPFINR